MENGSIFRAMSPFETLNLVEIEHKFYDVKTGELMTKNLQGYVKRETNKNMFILDDDEFEEAIKAWSEAARESARQSRTGMTTGRVGPISRAMWDHEKKRIDSAMDQHRGDKEGFERALLSRASKIGDPRKMVAFYHALTDENFHTVASKVEGLAKSKFKLSSEDINSPKFLDKSLLQTLKAWSSAARASASQARSHSGLQSVSTSAVQRKVKDGLWEAVTDKGKSGLQEFRDTRSGKRFTVQIEKSLEEMTDEEFAVHTKAWSESARASAKLAKGMGGDHSVVNIRPTGTGKVDAVAHGGSRGAPFIKVGGEVAHVKDRMTNAIQKLQHEGLWHKGEAREQKYGGGTKKGPKFDLKPGQGWTKPGAKVWGEKARNVLDKAGFKDVQIGAHSGD